MISCVLECVSVWSLYKLWKTACVKTAFHDTDIDTDTDSHDTPASLRPTRAISSRGSSRGIARVGVAVVECGLNDTKVGKDV